jgi:putative serine protease PepD
MSNEARRAIRLVALGLMIGLGGWWAGARWGERQPLNVEALLSTASPAPLDSDEEVNVRVYRDASPGVANIVTTVLQYDFFFNAVPTEGAGSGFVIDAQGHILTNYHVVQGAQDIQVTLGDSRSQKRFTAKFIGGDPRNDVALLRIDPGDHKLIALPLADSSALQVGQRVLAIGNPFGFQSTLTTGVVSALGRTIQTGQTNEGVPTFIDEAIQTDAAINRGNSGGPLLNSAGQVIGVNTAIFTPTGTTAGIGFAIPINTARRIVKDILEVGRPRQAYMGIEGTPLWDELAAYLEAPVTQGMLIENVAAGGPAARAGIRGGSRTVVAGMRRLAIGGDIITAIDSEPITDRLSLNVVMNRKRPGDVVTVTLYRGREKMDVRVTLGEMQAAPRRRS